MRSSIALLSVSGVLLAALHGARANEPIEPPTPFAITLSHSEPNAGDRVLFALTYTNQGSAPVRIPADLFATATFRGHRCPLSGCQVGVGYGMNVSVRLAGDKGIPAARLAWTTLKPGQALARVEDFSKLYPQDCDKKGCDAGTYTLVVDVPDRLVADLAPDQVVPPSHAQTLQVEVRPRNLAITSPDAVSLVAKLKRAGTGSLSIQATVKNLLDQPMYFPKADALLTDCQLRVVKRSGESEVRGSAQGVGGQSPLDETEALVVAAHGSKMLKLTCSADLTAEAGDVFHVRVQLTPFRAWEPRRPAVVLHWDAVLESAEVKLK